MHDYIKKYEEWLNNPCFDEETKCELQSIQGNEEEIKDRFYKDLEFGTAGLRGVIGIGTNRMNRYTVGKATQGLANYILKKGVQAKGVAISYDSRRMSKEFSEQTALILNANGIKTYVFRELRPVPELSFAVRELNCTAGIMITASHNPPKYNGYKVYWEDGAQIVPPTDKEIINEVNSIVDYSSIKTMQKEEAVSKGLYNSVLEEIDEKYTEALKKQVLNPDVIKEQANSLKIVYTPLHGTGAKPVRKILGELGFEQVYIVPEQEQPDGLFPTVELPNPEDPKAFNMAIELAKKIDADIITATDPDADRLGVFAKDSRTGEYKTFTGNMSAMLIAEYVLSQRQEKGILSNNGVLIKTIVSTNLANAIAKEYSLELVEVLTGFKNIGQKMREFEQKGDKTYAFGFEESYGCLVGTHARDKDGIVAVMLLCEAAAYYKKMGLTLVDQMENIYKKYGYYKESQVSIVMEGAEGAEKIKQMMDDLRSNAPEKIGNYKVKVAKDYLISKSIDIETKEETKIEIPVSNVLYYELENEAWCCARPSGTEPKIKFYMGVKEEAGETADKKLEELKQAVMSLAK